MATIAAPSRSASTLSPATQSSATRIWPLYATLCSSACIVVGLLWDISWHQTVGRDTFWTLPHLLEQFGAILAGFSCGWLVLSTTFRGSPEERAQSVFFWGFRGPLGAWMTIWGTFVMITTCALRQLVAQRVRPRRADREPAAHGSRDGYDRDPDRCAALRSWRAEPRNGCA